MSLKTYHRIMLIFATIAVGGIALFIFWVPSFFVDEFYNVSITYAEKGVSISPSPDELQHASLSKWTDVSATFKNGSNGACQVEVQSSSFTKNFKLEKHLEYGLLLPKKETITLSFCGVEKNIKID